MAKKFSVGGSSIWNVIMFAGNICPTGSIIINNNNNNHLWRFRLLIIKENMLSYSEIFEECQERNVNSSLACHAYVQWDSNLGIVIAILHEVLSPVISTGWWCEPLRIFNNIKWENTLCKEAILYRIAVPVPRWKKFMPCRWKKVRATADSNPGPKRSSHYFFMHAVRR